MLLPSAVIVCLVAPAVMGEEWAKTDQATQSELTTALWLSLFIAVGGAIMHERRRSRVQLETEQKAAEVQRLKRQAEQEKVLRRAEEERFSDYEEELRWRGGSRHG